MSTKKNIVIAEDAYLLRKGLALAVAQLPSVENVTELVAGTPYAAQIEEHDADIVIVNPILLGMTNAKSTPYELLKIEKDIPVIALVYSLIDDKFLQYFDAVINITDSLEAISTKIQTVMNEMDNQRNDTTEELSDREKEILVALVKGMINKEIADYFNLSIHTIIAHRRNITRKLGIHSVSGLTVYAILNKLVNVHDIEII